MNIHVATDFQFPPEYPGGWVVVNLAAAGLNNIADAVADALNNRYKKAGVVVFDLGALDRGEP
jgi:hypothetical protein